MEILILNSRLQYGGDESYYKGAGKRGPNVADILLLIMFLEQGTSGTQNDKRALAGKPGKLPTQGTS